MIDKIMPGVGVSPVLNAKPAQAGNGGTDIGQKFGDLLNEALNKIGADQKQVEQYNQLFAAGQMQDVHQLLLTAEKASLNLELTVQIRNKVIEAYQEIMRTQI